MSLKEVGKILARAGSSSVSVLLNQYSDDIVEIHRQIYSSPGLKADLKVPAHENFYDLIRFSAFAYDHTTISLIWGSQRQMKIPDRLPDGLKISIPADEAEKYASYHSGRVLAVPVLMMDDDEETANLLKLICPLIESGRLLVRPQRGLMMFSPEDDKKSFSAIDDRSPLDHWQVPNDTSGSDAVPVLHGRSSDSSERELFEVSFPFLAGVPFGDLAKVLDDEEHHLAEARASLRKTVDEAKSHCQEISTIADDVLRPELDKLSRRFQTLSNSQALKRSGALFGIVTLSFAAAISSGVLAALAAAGGAGGFGLLAKIEADHIEKVSEAKDNPNYFLWRCREIPRPS